MLESREPGRVTFQRFATVSRAILEEVDAMLFLVPVIAGQPGMQGKGLERIG
jgi:hypothetical protein